MTTFLVLSILEIILLRLHNPIGLVLIPPWVITTIKLARSGQ